VDTAPDANPNCNYSESNDDDNANASTGEPTGLLVTSQRTTLCGSFASDHFDGDITVDEDSFLVETAAPVDLMVRIIGNASTIEYAGLDVYDGATRIGGVTYYGDHAVGEVHLPAGTFRIALFALNTTAIATPVTYTVEMIGDTPSGRCLELSAGGYTEANDGGGNNGNDVFTIPDGAPIALTTSGADAAEPSMLTLGTTPTRLAGSAADIAMADQYEDRDAYAFRTDGTVNELTVRLTWSGTANLDFLLFEGNALQAEFRANTVSTASPELRTYSIKPSRDYTLLVAAKPGATTFPVPYTATLCAERYE